MGQRAGICESIRRYKNIWRSVLTVRPDISLSLALVLGVSAIMVALAPAAEANSCAANCRAQHNQCRISTKGSPSCDARLQQCLQSCLKR